MVFKTENWRVFLVMMLLTIIISFGVTMLVAYIHKDENHKDNKRNIKQLHTDLNGLVYDVTTTDESGNEVTSTETLVLEDLDY